VDDCDVHNVDALKNSKEVVPPSLDPDTGAISGGASTVGEAGEAGEAAEGRLQGGGNAGLVHDKTQNPFQDTMAKRDLSRQGGATHCVMMSMLRRVAQQVH
jgi:hypothetical protein